MDTSNAPTPRNAHRTARAEAAAWIVCLHGPHRSPELEAAFRDWLAAHPENGKQFERVTEVWDAGSSVPVPGAPRLARWKEPLVPRQWTLAAAVLLVVCGLAGWGAWRAWADPTYTTGIGEQRIVRLDDGTRLSLNSGTRVRIAYNNSERRVELERGEAYFEVAHNPARPFIVTAGNHQVTALGTVFVVRYETAQTAVTLLEGKVAVLPLPDSPSLKPLQLPQNSPLTIPEDSTGTRSARANRHPSISLSPSPSNAEGELILSPGERVTFTRGGSPKLDEPRMEAVTAWRRGEVMLDKTELADAIAELNRYDKTKLIIDDPKIAALPSAASTRPVIATASHVLLQNFTTSKSLRPRTESTCGPRQNVEGLNATVLRGAPAWFPSEVTKKVSPDTCGIAMPQQSTPADQRVLRH